MLVEEGVVVGDQDDWPRVPRKRNDGAAAEDRVDAAPLPTELSQVRARENRLWVGEAVSGSRPLAHRRTSAAEERAELPAPRQFTTQVYACERSDREASRAISTTASFSGIR